MKMTKAMTAAALTLCLCACSSREIHVCPDIQLEASVIPYPQQFDLHKGALYLDNSLIVLSKDFEDRTLAVTRDFANQLSECTSSQVEVKTFCCTPCKGASLTIAYDAELPDEAYEIKVDESGATVKSSSHNGVLYALATLRQMLPPAIYSSEASDAEFAIPFCEIQDSPAYSYRGVMLDCARHFFPVENVKRLLDAMAAYKLNRFHWHLTDDQGWRIESKKYPKLIEVGSMRSGTMVGRDWNSDDHIPHGGYYTQEQLREVVDYAWKLGITIVPEIDLPGHMVAALASYPELGCTGGPYEVRKIWGIADQVLCAGKDETYRFLDEVLCEVADIFPGELFHIGGDECPKVEWEKCPHCQAKIAELGLEDKDGVSAEQYLQNYVTHHVQKTLASKGKRIIGWDEITEGELDKGVTVMYWRGWLPVEKSLYKYTADGYDVIMTPTSYFYIDYLQSEDMDSEPVGFQSVLTIDKMYSFDQTKGLSPEQLSHIKGVQANLWTEYVSTWEHAEYMLFPRLFALSCIAWDGDERPDFESFMGEVKSHQFPVLDNWGYNYRNR